GALLELGRTTYVPPAALADQVRARDVTCRFPGCRRPAIGCDLDHTRRHPDGPTCPCNLAALCRHHHRLKHHTDWTVVQDEHGVLTWTSPTGHVYRTYPPPRGQPEQPAPPEQTAGVEQSEPAGQPAPVDHPTAPEASARAEADQPSAEQPATGQPTTEQPTRTDHDTAA
ncbi:MAG TPA: HNH endonuclease, partial [Actinomycetes bacterium]|nr:HNH endonuclease [Actinomycetes bacterium]